MISNAERAGKFPYSPHSGKSFAPADFPLTEQDRSELRTNRGLSEAIIAAARLGSVRTQADLDELGFAVPFDEILSSILIPFPERDPKGNFIPALHKRMLTGIPYPPYEAPPTDSNITVLAESPLKALAVRQLGFNAVGLHGIFSHIKRCDELAAAVRAQGGAHCVVLLDTVRDIADPAALPEGRDEPLAALAYAFALEKSGLSAKIASLPKPYLTEAFGRDEQKYLRGDIDEALAAGLTEPELRVEIEAARTPWEFDAPIDTKVKALWLAMGETILSDPESIETLFKGRPISDVSKAMSALASCARNSTYDSTTKKFDEPALSAYADAIKSLFKSRLSGLSIRSVRKLLQGGKDDQHPVTPPHDLGDYGLTELEHRVLSQRNGVDGETEWDLVANFTISSIQSGYARFLDGQCDPLHKIIIKQHNKATECEVEVVGSVYDVDAIQEATQGDITVVSPARFKNYMSHKIDIEGIQTRDASVNRVFVIGTYMDEKGQLTPSDGVRFPQGREECHYSGHSFATTGNKVVFDLVANLFRSPDVAVILLFGLGSIFKPALGWAYPHLAIEGDSGVGKSTIRDLLMRHFGWLGFSADLEFKTSYRAKKLLSNSVLPVQIEECGRVNGSGHHIMIDTLNQAYNLTPSTHGHLDKRFCLVTPAILWGQDFDVDDVALRAKVLRVQLMNADKNTAALLLCQAFTEPWPMNDWIRHGCDWANKRSLVAILDEKAAWIEEQVRSPDLMGVTNVGRIIRNYATLLLTSDAMNEFGVSVDVGDHVVRLVRTHLALILGEGADEDRRTIARQFIGDVVDHILGDKGSRGLVYDWNVEGLFIRVQSAMPVLQKAGRRYDIKGPDRLRKMLVDEGLGVATKHYFQGVERRCLLLTSVSLESLGIKFSVGTAVQQL